MKGANNSRWAERGKLRAEEGQQFVGGLNLLEVKVRAKSRKCQLGLCEIGLVVNTDIRVIVNKCVRALEAKAEPNVSLL